MALQCIALNYKALAGQFAFLSVRSNPSPSIGRFVMLRLERLQESHLKSLLICATRRVHFLWLSLLFIFFQRWKSWLGKKVLFKIFLHMAIIYDVTTQHPPYRICGQGRGHHRHMFLHFDLTTSITIWAILNDEAMRKKKHFRNGKRGNRNEPQGWFFP